jgi:hypothetical protein
MRREQEDQLDPNQPALVVVYGRTKRKHRPLLGDVVVLGRAPGCDIGISSPEVAPVHCLIIRSGDGWRLRDCAGRSTQVNGRAIRDVPLKNGDVIQVGTFSFEVYLPAVAAGQAPATTSPQQEHIEQSRRRFAERALRLRERVREQERAAAELAQREADLGMMERRLRQIHAEGVKQGKPDQEQKALEVERSALTAQREQLDARARELNQFAQHVRRQQQEQLRQSELDRAGFESDLNRLRVELESDRAELLSMRQAIQQRQNDLEAAIEAFQAEVQRERAQLSGERRYIDQQRQELIRQREELQHQRNDTPSADPAELPSTKETWSDVSPDRLESARRLLRELAERRKATN